MGEFVGDDLGLRPAYRRRGAPGVQEDERVPEGDESGVLHGPGREVGDRDKSSLAYGYGMAKYSLSWVTSPAAVSSASPVRLRAPLGRDGAHREGVLLPLHDVEVADGERHEIAREGRGRREMMLHHVRRARRSASFRGVGEGDRVAGGGDA